MKALLVNPVFPDSYWSGAYVRPYVRWRAPHAPLPLITVAALLPEHWTCRLVDLNTGPLTDDDLRWADIVMLSGMIVQRRSLHEVLHRCHRLGVRTAVGGPYASELPDELELADHVVIGEGEEIVPKFARDLDEGCARPRYREARKPDMTKSPVPRYDLLDPTHYAQIPLQYSRGCPFKCEFCDIIVLYGRVPRLKTTAQVLAELEAIRATGFIGDVPFVDDNFIGNKKAVKALLPEIAAWRRRNKVRFNFWTQATMNIADDPRLVDMMTDAGFTMVSIGIETPSEESLREAGKFQNLRRDMVSQVHWLLGRGLTVNIQLILGFDSDGPDIFDRMIDFVERCGIPYPGIGVLTALPNTPLYDRLAREGRLKPEYFTGETYGITNIVPKMPVSELANGYRRVLETLFRPEAYFERCRANLTRWKPSPHAMKKPILRDLLTAARLMWGQGVQAPYRRTYWSFLGWALRHQPKKLAQAFYLAGGGHHYMTYTRKVAIPALERRVPPSASPRPLEVLPGGQR